MMAVKTTYYCPLFPVGFFLSLTNDINITAGAVIIIITLPIATFNVFLKHFYYIHVATAFLYYGHTHDVTMIIMDDDI